MRSTRPADRRRRRWLVALTVVAMAFVQSGCDALNGPSTVGPVSTSGKVEKPLITVGILAAADYAPVKIAQKKGFFQQEGLTVDAKVFPAGPATLAALSGGHLDITLANYVTFFQAVTKNPPLDMKIVSDAYQANDKAVALITQGNSGIEQAKDLVGKKVSVHQLNSIGDLLLQVLLRDNGIDVKSVDRVEVKFPDIGAALDNNLISAGVEIEPYITQNELKYGERATIPLVAGDTADMPLSGYAAMSKFIHDNPKTIAAFQRAMAKAQKLAADRKELADVVPELAGIDRQTVSIMNIGTFPTTLDATRIQRVATLMSTYGVLPKPLDVKPYLLPTPTN